MEEISEREAVLGLFESEDPISVNHYSLYKKDYECLFEGRWLRTETINTLISLLYTESYLQKAEQLNKESLKILSNSSEGEEEIRKYLRIMDPFICTMIMMMGQDEVLMTLEQQEFFSAKTKYLVIPINTEDSQQGQGSHWFLLLFENGRYTGNKSTLSVYDSVPLSPSLSFAAKMKAKLQRMVSLFHNEHMDIGVERVKELPLQKNGYDCGVFTIGYTEWIFEEALKEKYKNYKGSPTLWNVVQQSSKQRQRYRKIVEQLLLPKK